MAKIKEVKGKTLKDLDVCIIEYIPQEMSTTLYLVVYGNTITQEQAQEFLTSLRGFNNDIIAIYR